MTTTIARDNSNWMMGGPECGCATDARVEHAHLVAGRQVPSHGPLASRPGAVAGWESGDMSRGRLRGEGDGRLPVREQ